MDHLLARCFGVAQMLIPNQAILVLRTVIRVPNLPDTRAAVLPASADARSLGRADLLPPEFKIIPRPQRRRRSEAPGTRYEVQEVKSKALVLILSHTSVP